MNRIFSQTINLRNAVRMVELHLNPEANIILVGSRPGMGKTHIVREELARQNLPFKNISVTLPVALVDELWKHCHEKVVVLDDCDRLARSEPCANIMKRVLAGDKRCSWHSKKAAANDALRGTPNHNRKIAPVEFKFYPNVVWCSNIDFADEGALEHAMLPHFHAVISRGYDPIWIDTSDPDELLEYTLGLRDQMGIVPEAVDWFISKRSYLKDITPRALKKVSGLFRTAKGSALTGLLEGCLVDTPNHLRYPHLLTFTVSTDGDGQIVGSESGADTPIEPMLHYPIDDSSTSDKLMMSARAAKKHQKLPAGTLVKDMVYKEPAKPDNRRRHQRGRRFMGRGVKA